MWSIVANKFYFPGFKGLLIASGVIYIKIEY